MKKYMVLFSAFLLLFALSGIAGAYTINYDYVAAGNEYTSPYASNAGSETEDFNDSPALLWQWYDNGVVVSGSVSGLYAAPMGIDGVNRDATLYVTVPEYITEQPQSASADLDPDEVGFKYNYLGLWWGSVDTYNTLSFYYDNTLVASVTGSQATTPNAANGNQSAPSTNLYVNVLGLPWFNSFTMTSTQYAFEADNITVGVVPEPTTMLLLGLGLVGVAGIRRKFKS